MACHLQIVTFIVTSLKMTEVEAVLAEVTRTIRADADARDAQREQRKMPRLTLTYAQSIDGSIAAERGIPTLLSGSASMQMTHQLRTLHDGILVGIGTILADNPSLNARFAEGANPQPIILDSRLECPLFIKLFTQPTCRKPIILCSSVTDDDMRARRTALETAGAKVIECESCESASGSNGIDIRCAFERLVQEGITSIMIEGGASVILTCLQLSAVEHFIDRVIITVAPTFIGGLHAVSRRVSEAGAFPRLRDAKYWKLGEDLVISGQFP